MKSTIEVTGENREESAVLLLEELLEKAPIIIHNIQIRKDPSNAFRWVASTVIEECKPE